VAKQVAKKTAPAAKGKAVAMVDKKAVGAAVDMNLLLRQDSGKGVSTAAEDNIIPLIYILQSQSPQALKQKPEYIKGAEAGNIWPRGTKTLIDGENEGMPFIPVAFSKSWVEWRPDRGGFVGRHKYDATREDKGRPAGTRFVEDPKAPGLGKWTTPSGNIVVETREHAGLGYIDEQWSGCVISMSGSNHTASRAWMGLMKGKKIPGSDDRAPSFAYVYSLKTIAKSNDKGDWYGWQAEDGQGDGEVTFLPEIDNGVELYKMARQLNADFEAGIKVADAPAELDTETSTEADNDDI
jgi:hypothetical protein